MIVRVYIYDGILFGTLYVLNVLYWRRYVIYIFFILNSEYLNVLDGRGWGSGEYIPWTQIHGI